MNLNRIFRANIFHYTLNYLIGVSVAVFIVLAVVYASISYRFFRDTDALIAAEAAQLEQRFDASGRAGLAASISERIQEPGFPRLFYLLVDSGGSKITGNLARWPEHFDGEGRSLDIRAAFRSWLASDVPYQFIGSGAYLGNGDRLLVARHYQDINEYLRITLTVLLQAMLTTIVLGSIGAALLTAILDRRVEAINDSIATILSGDLSQRIPLARGTEQDDFARLIVNFNSMLDRIEQLMEGLRQLSDNIAHDLRTPLTRLRNHLAELELDAGGRQREDVGRLIEEADALLATFNALLRIARIESGNQRSAILAADVVQIVGDVAEFYEPLAADKGIEVRATLPVASIAPVDRDLLFQALANLLDNAIKYAGAGTVVTLGLREEPDAVCIEVADNGPGIPEAERERVFDRFYRVEASRGLHPGNGLGLSLVQAVANLHGGSVALGDNAPGLRVRLRLPRGSAQGTS